MFCSYIEFWTKVQERLKKSNPYKQQDQQASAP